MSNGKTNRSLLVIIIALLLTNVAVLGYFLWYKKKPSGYPHRGNGIADVLKKDAGFSDEQVAKYKEMRDKQRQTIRPMFDDMRKSKDSLFSQINNEQISDSAISVIADQIARKQRAIDLQTFTYFRSVRKLCTPEQLPKYDSIVLKMLKGMGQSPKSDEKKNEKK